jgi:hypothetical protein
MEALLEEFGDVHVSHLGGSGQSRSGDARPTGIRRRWCAAGDLGVSDTTAWPDGDALLAAVGGRCLLALPGTVLAGKALTGFLDRVAPFGSPPPHSLIRAYGLPDQPFPSVLLREHTEAPDGTGPAYDRFLAHARAAWMAALAETGPGLCPALAWETGAARRFVQVDGALTDTELAGVPDDYLGRGLLLLADPGLAQPWQGMMSLGGVTKARKITGREFPVWVDLPAHQPALLASGVLARAEALLAEM